MSDILLDNQALASTPASGKSIIAVDSTTKKPYSLDDGGIPRGILSKNDIVAAQDSIATTEVYITNSNVQIPSFGMKAGQQYVWAIQVSKTNAGTAALVVTVRIGNAGAIGDTSRIALTQNVAQAAVTSDGIMHFVMTVRSVGASGVLAASFGFSHVTAFGDGKNGNVTYDNTAEQGKYVGLTLTTGASAVWSIKGGYGILIG